MSDEDLQKLRQEAMADINDHPAWRRYGDALYRSGRGPENYIQEVIASAGREIKRAVMAEAAKIMEWPEIRVGVGDTAQSMRGVLVYEEVNIPPPELDQTGGRGYEILFPDGLFSLTGGTFIDPEIDPSEGGDFFPDFTERIEKPENYILYGGFAIASIGKVLEAERRKDYPEIISGEEAT